MIDRLIVRLYLERNENAIIETDRKYKNYCYVIANNILNNPEDSKETVNDTYLRVWNSIPPKRPKNLRTFLGKITRNLAVDKWRKKSAQKRRDEMTVALEELEDCISDVNFPEEFVQADELSVLISEFLWTLPAVQRRLFVQRYWYLEPISNLCREFHFSQSKVTSMLFRLRIQLKNYLDERGEFN